MSVGPRRSVNIRPAVSMLGHAAVIVPATLFAAAGGAGLIAGGAVVAGGAAYAVKHKREQARKLRESRERKTQTTARAEKAARIGRSSGRAGGGSTRTRSGRAGTSGSAKGRGLFGGKSRGHHGATASRSGSKGGSSIGSRGGGSGSRSHGLFGNASRSSGRGATSNRSARAAKMARALGTGAAGAARATGRALDAGIRGTAGLMGRIREAWAKSGEEMARKRRAAERERIAKARQEAAMAGRLGVATAVRSSDVKDDRSPGVLGGATYRRETYASRETERNWNTTGGTGMATSPMTQALELAQQMTQVMMKWNPKDDRQSALAVIKELEKWPEVIRELSRAARVMSTKASDPREGFPLNAVVLESIESVHRNQASVATSAEEIGRIARILHAGEIQVMETHAGKANADMWSPALNHGGL